MKYIIPLLIFVFLTSCTNDLPVKIPDDGYVTVNINTGPVPVVVTRSDIDYDKTITTIDILVFENGFYSYYATGQDITGSSAGYNFSARLKSSDDVVEMLVMANVRDKLTSQYPEAGTPLTQVIANLEGKLTREGLKGYVPMSGYYRFATGLTSTDQNIFDLKLLRSLAGITVTVADEIESEFSLHSIQVFRSRDFYRVYPEEYLLTSVTAPTIPAGAGRLSTTEQIMAGTNSHAISGLYIPEYDQADFPDDTEKICLVVGGYYGSGSKPTYYKLDFKDQSGWKNILRNHQYNFRIISVRGEGWEGPDEAAENDSSEIIVDIIDWEPDDRDIIIDGVHYISLSSRTIETHYYKHSVGGVTLDTNYDKLTVQWADGSTTVAEPGTVITDLSNTFELKIESDKKSIKARTLSDNDGGTRTAFATVQAGRVTMNITIRQGTEAERPYINIYNIGGRNAYASIGDDIFGHPFFIAGANQDMNLIMGIEYFGRGLREMINNNDDFGPAGTVKFAGFRIGGQPYTISPSPYVLDLFDVLYVPALREDGDNTDYIPDSYIQNIVTWLEHPRHILIVQGDYGSNKRLLTELGIIVSDTTMQIGTRYVLHDNAPKSVSEGPFGILDEEFNVVNGSQRAYIKGSDHPEIAPILFRRDYNNSTKELTGNNPDQIILGVDNARKIIFCGDYSLYMASTSIPEGYMTGGGIISNNNDKLIANALAWVAKTVMGDQQFNEEFKWD